MENPDKKEEKKEESKGKLVDAHKRNADIINVLIKLFNLLQPGECFEATVPIGKVLVPGQEQKRGTIIVMKPIVKADAFLKSIGDEN